MNQLRKELFVNEKLGWGGNNNNKNFATKYYGTTSPRPPFERWFGLGYAIGLKVANTVCHLAHRLSVGLLRVFVNKMSI